MRTHFVKSSAGCAKRFMIRSTPASALPAISSKLAEFDERMRMAEESGSLFDVNDDVTEVAEDVGASVV